MAKRIWGCLEMSDGNIYNLNGMTPDEYVWINPDMITGFDPDDLGDEANICVENEDETTTVLTNLEEIKNLFRGK